MCLVLSETSALQSHCRWFCFICKEESVERSTSFRKGEIWTILLFLLPWSTRPWKVKWKLIRDRKNYTTQLTQHWPFASMCTNSMLTQSLLRNQGEVEAECANPSQTVMSFQACGAVGSISTFTCFYIRIIVVISLNLLTWFQLFLCVAD